LCFKKTALISANLIKQDNRRISAIKVRLVKTRKAEIHQENDEETSGKFFFTTFPILLNSSSLVFLGIAFAKENP
jgi:hypothetical protein